MAETVVIILKHAAARGFQFSIVRLVGLGICHHVTSQK